MVRAAAGVVPAVQGKNTARNKLYLANTLLRKEASAFLRLHCFAWCIIIQIGSIWIVNPADWSGVI